MPSYLHQPIRDGAAVAGLVSMAESETIHLEFKGGFWEKAQSTCKGCGARSQVDKSDALEAAKDVAGLLNAEGGDIVVGVSAKADRANGWYGSEPPADADETLRRWLRNYLAPREAADFVEPRILVARDQGDDTEHRVLVVNVAPWPFGPVAVQSDVDPQKRANYTFAVRRGRETTYQSFEEIMRLNDGRRRSAFLRIRELAPELASGGAVPFVLRSAFEGGSHGVPPRPEGSRYGEITSISQETITLAFEEFGTAIPAAKLIAPLEVVEAVWKDTPIVNLIALLLTRRLLWDGRKWQIA
jgi:hypothetical protein